MMGPQIKGMKKKDEEPAFPNRREGEGDPSPRTKGRAHHGDKKDRKGRVIVCWR